MLRDVYIFQIQPLTQFPLVCSAVLATMASIFFSIFHWKLPLNSKICQFDQPLEILYQDQYLVAINKPADLLVHRSPIDRHEHQFALQMLRDQIGQYVWPLHRLDKPTSGVLVFGLSAEVASVMGQRFRENATEYQLEKNT